MQVSLRRRFSKGFRANVNYTWSHALDDGGIPWGSGTQDDTNPREAYADGDMDVRHALQFDYTYELASVPKLPHWIGGGWQVNGITVMRAGLPVTPLCWCDTLGVGNFSGRPDIVPGEPLYPANQDIPGNQFNIKAFTAPKPGVLGNAGRNILNGPAALNWDFSLFKNFNVAEGQTVQFRAEMFNVFNTPQFNNPHAIIAFVGSFGQSTSTHTVPFTGFGSNRQIQFALRYSF